MVEANRNDRDSKGRFAAGNSGGPGNPHGKRCAQLRAAMLARVTEGDLQEIIAALIARAKAGDVPAAREVLDRSIGRVVPQPDDEEADQQPARIQADLNVLTTEELMQYRAILNKIHHRPETDI